MRISIVIPTRERGKYLKHCLETCVAIEDPGVEIVVSDNASQDGTKDIVGSFSDSRIKYVNTGQRVSMRQNWDFAMEHTTGDYIIYIGDDDGMLPRQFPHLRLILETYRPPVIKWKPVSYWWPREGRLRKAGYVRFKSRDTYGLPEATNSTPIADRLERADLSGLHARIPDVYHGCSSRHVFDAIKADAGLYFGSKIPDTYFSYFSIFMRDEFSFIDHPFTVGGSSPASTAHSHTKENFDNRQEATTFLQEVTQDAVQDVIPVRARSFLLNLFSTLETVRRDAQKHKISPDYLAWYKLILTPTKQDLDGAAKEAREQIERFARLTNTHSTFERASMFVGNRIIPESILYPSTSAFSKGLSRVIDVRASAEVNGENTSASAATVIDTLIGDGHPIQKRSNIGSLRRGLQFRRSKKMSWVGLSG